jgi:hypothetical protein
MWSFTSSQHWVSKWTHTLFLTEKKTARRAWRFAILSTGLSLKRNNLRMACLQTIFFITGPSLQFYMGKPNSCPLHGYSRLLLMVCLADGTCCWWRVDGFYSRNKYVPSVVLKKNNVSLKNDKKTYGAAVIACQRGHTVLLKPPTWSPPNLRYASIIWK